MNVQQVIDELNQTRTLSKETILRIEEDSDLRSEFIEYFDKNKNRDFVLSFLNILSELRLRRDTDTGISGDSLMLACFVLGKHEQIEDCLIIWETKELDFDTHCYVDIQLVMFAGVEQTINYLKNQTSEEAKQALKYVVECSIAGDFDDLEQYFNNTPWFV